MHLGQHFGQHVGQHFGAIGGPIVLAPTLPICVHVTSLSTLCAVSAGMSVQIIDNSIHATIVRGPCD